MIISDNGMYGTIGMHSYVRYPERPFLESTQLTNPDFAAWGRSFGAEGITIRDEPRSRTASPAPSRSRRSRWSCTASPRRSR